MNIIEKITASDIATARAIHPGSGFHVFQHAQDNEGASRVDVRRDGTYSPVSIGDYSYLREIHASLADAARAATRIQALLDAAKS